MNNVKQISALTIAGSDSSGGAGIQADLKTFTVHNVYGASIITNITAQNTQKVISAEPVSGKMIQQQWDAVIADLNLKFVKIGMLGGTDVISLVAKLISTKPKFKYIVDPVMISKSGYSLLLPQAVVNLKELIIKQAYLVTPNIQEAEKLANIKIANIDDVYEGCRRIAKLGAQNILIKGGHLQGAPIDVLYNPQTGSFFKFSGTRHSNRFTHGTGCTLSAAITANLTNGYSLKDAIKYAKVFVNKGIATGKVIGKGINPINFNNN